MGIVHYLFLYLSQVVCHGNTDGWASGKKEIRNVYFPFKVLLRDRFSILIGQRKICNSMVFFLMLKCAVHQLKIYHGRLVDGQSGRGG